MITTNPKANGRALIAEDDASLRAVLRFNLEEEGLAVTAVSRGDDAIAALKQAAAAGEPFELVVSDVKMPGAGGLEVLDAAMACHADSLVIMVTAYGTVEHATEAVAKGAVDYITKPFRRAEFKTRIHHALAINRTQQEDDSDREGQRIISHSPKIAALLQMLERVAKADVAVLITGESGTGKELFARRVHRRSGRSGAFIPVNCAALPDNLLESELFGVDKGAFTGADRARMGKFEQAQGGTLLLDEIGELSLAMQPKILRVLEEGVVDRLGGRSVAVDVRIVAATNRDLEDAVRAGRFREDLYHRLAVVPLHIPPLRERPDDIELLARHFLRTVSDERVELSTTLIRELRRLPWSGNVRELRNVVQRMCLLRRGRFLDLADLVAHGSHATLRPLPTTEPQPAAGEIATVETSSQAQPHIHGLLCPGDLVLPDAPFGLRDIEREIIQKALARHDGNRSATARYLRIPRHVLLYNLAKYKKEEQATTEESHGT